MRSSMRRSTPGIGGCGQSSRAACPAARAPKAELRFMVAEEGSDRVEVLGPGRDLAELDLLDDLDELGVGGGGTAHFLALGGDQPVDEIDLGAPAFEHILAHRRAGQFAPGVRLQTGEDLRFDLLERGAVTLAGAGDRFGLMRANVLELVAERLADANPLAGEPDAETPDLLVPVHVVAGQARRGGDTIRHAVDAQLRPALAP